MHVFSDHAGLVIDPFGMKVSNENTPHATAIPDLHGVRISPRQSPTYDSIVNQSSNIFSDVIRFFFFFF